MKKFLMSCVFVLVTGFACKTLADVVPAGDIQTPDIALDPPIMTDSVRGLIGNILALTKAGPEPETGAVLNVHQEEVGALQDGDESYRVDEGTGSGADDLAITAYDHVKKNVFTSSKKTPYAPLNQKLKDGADMQKVVKEMFFIENEADNTEEKQAEVVKNRTQYLTTVGREYTKLAYEVQQKLINDMSAVSSDINGNGSIGAVSGMDQTWKAVNKALIADIGLQIQLMELDAAKFLSVQPIMIMSKERPADNNQGGNS